MDLFTREELDELYAAKIETRIADAKYLRSHPEIEVTMTALLEHCLINQPKTQLAQAMADFLKKRLADRGST
jgi:hypothetical protein